jgi:transcriptional regulator with XRE-family HTH domain
MWIEIITGTRVRYDFHAPSHARITCTLTLLMRITSLMTNDAMSSNRGNQYGQMVRDARIRLKYTQRELGELVGVKPSTIANLESSPFRVVRRDRLERVCARLSMGDEERDRVLAAFDAAPISDFQKRQREKWAKMREDRKAVKASTSLRDALIGLLALVASCGESIAECACAATTPEACELCEAMRAVGLERWESAEAADASIAGLSTPVEKAVDADDFG